MQVKKKWLESLVTDFGTCPVCLKITYNSIRNGNQLYLELTSPMKVTNDVTGLFLVNISLSSLITSAHV